MKQTFSLLLILITGTCHSQTFKTDPYFMETSDTVSVYGPRSITRHILEDKNGNMWFATWQGIMKYDGKVFTNYTLKKNLIHFHVFSIMEDRAGNLWFGTIRGGLYKYDGKSFTLFTTYDGLANDLVGYMMEDRTGKIWIATDEGISILDTAVLRSTRAKSTVTPWAGLPLTSKKGFTNYTTANGLTGDRVNTIMQDKTGKMWIGTRTGVSIYDGNTFTNFTKQGVPFTNVWSIKEDRTGKIWIGGNEGLYCYDPGLTGEKVFTQLVPDFIGCVFEDKAGNLWFNSGNRSSAGGMALYKYDGKTITKIVEKNTHGDSQVFEITEDKNGNIWFGTMNGATKYDGKVFNGFRKLL